MNVAKGTTNRNSLKPLLYINFWISSPLLKMVNFGEQKFKFDPTGFVKIFFYIWSFNNIFPCAQFNSKQCLNHGKRTWEIFLFVKLHFANNRQYLSFLLKCTLKMIFPLSIYFYSVVYLCGVKVTKFLIQSCLSWNNSVVILLIPMIFFYLKKKTFRNNAMDAKLMLLQYSCSGREEMRCFLFQTFSIKN